MNVILEGEGSWVGFHPVPSTPKVLDPKRESGVPLEPQPFICQNFYQTKDAGHPQFKVWSPFLDPKSGSGRTRAPCPSGAMVTHFVK